MGCDLRKIITPKMLVKLDIFRIDVMLTGTKISNEVKLIVNDYQTDGKDKLNNHNVADVYQYAAIAGRIDVMMDIDKRDFFIPSTVKFYAIKLILPIAPHPIVMHYLSYPFSDTMNSELLEFAETNGVVNQRTVNTFTPTYHSSNPKKETVVQSSQNDKNPSARHKHY